MNVVKYMGITSPLHVPALPHQFSPVERERFSLVEWEHFPLVEVVHCLVYCHWISENVYKQRPKGGYA